MASAQYRGLTLKEKLELSWKGELVDSNAKVLADRSSAVYFVFISVTQLYVFLCYIIPYNYSEWSDMSRYYLKVLTVFVFIQGVGNWLCVRCYSSRNNYRKHTSSYIPTTHAANGHVAITIDKMESQSNGYLNWRYCHDCQLQCPPRSHHCKICNVCIMKRDHHCYFTGVCIGHFNQRYFIMLNFYTAIASIYGLYEIYLYMSPHYFTQVESWSDYFLPWVVLKWLFSRTVSTHIMLMMCQIYTLWWTGGMAVGFFCTQMFVSSLGLTAYEHKNEIPVKCTGTFSQNMQEVFGVFWGFNFIMPAQIMFRQQLDGTEWPNLKIKPDTRKAPRAKPTLKNKSMLNGNYTIDKINS